MAVVDLQSGKITGAKEKSAVWWHEKGHIEFNKTDEGIQIGYYFQFMLMMTTILLPFNLFIDSILLKIYTLLCGLSIFYFYAFEEIWAWAYSFKHKKEWA